MHEPLKLISIGLLQRKQNLNIYCSSFQILRAQVFLHSGRQTGLNFNDLFSSIGQGLELGARRPVTGWGGNTTTRPLLFLTLNTPPPYPALLSMLAVCPVYVYSMYCVHYVLCTDFQLQRRIIKDEA